MPGVELHVETATILRAVLHGVVFFVLGISLLAKRSTLRPMPAFFWGILSVMAMLVSVLVNAGDFTSVARVLLNVVMLVNIFVLFASLARDEGQIKTLAWCSVFIALSLSAISAYVILQHGFFPEWSLRLGRPLNPSVLSFAISTALISSFLLPLRGFVRLLLMMVLLLSASRLDVFLGLAFAIYFVLSDRKLRVKSLSVLLLFAALVGVLYAEFLAEVPEAMLPFSRSSLLSGRRDLWARGIDEVKLSPWFGVGDRAYVARLGGPLEWDAQRVHNMPLEIAMSYGIPASILVGMVYLSLARGIFRLRRLRIMSSKRYRTIGLGFLSLIVGHTMFGTSYWTNLGDGTILMILALTVSMTALVMRPSYLRGRSVRSARPARHRRIALAEIPPLGNLS